MILPTSGRRGDRVHEMWAWLTIDGADDCEGIPVMQAANGMALPLVGADRERMESFEPIVRQMAVSSGRTIVLARFSVREEVMRIDP